jgi:hypothetical protein
MNLSINRQEFEDKIGKQKLIFRGDNGQLFEIIPYVDKLENNGLSE